MKVPPRWKTALLIWLGIYPTVTLVSWIIGVYATDLPLPLRTLCLTVIVVPIMVWVMMPVLQKALHRWLNK